MGRNTSRAAVPFVAQHRVSPPRDPTRPVAHQLALARAVLLRSRSATVCRRGLPAGGVPSAAGPRAPGTPPGRTRRRDRGPTNPPAAPRGPSRRPGNRRYDDRGNNRRTASPGRRERRHRAPRRRRGRGADTHSRNKPAVSAPSPPAAARRSRHASGQPPCSFPSLSPPPSD